MSALVADPGRVPALAADIAAGRLTAVALVERCLARIDAVEPQVQAWVVVHADAALATARGLDAEAKAGHLRGPLHGIPVGVKDVIDLAGHRTRAFSPTRDTLAAATADATVVAHLRAAGAIVLGKLHTTELAFFDAVPPTRNPHDTSRTAGGSSAGSGAAVAAGMVPLALGTQTAASVNRPAAYCGIGAFKPSTLAIGGAGVLPLSPSFDTVGAMAGRASDAAVLAAAYAPAHLRLDAEASSPARIVVLDDPLLGEADAATAAALTGLAARLRDAGLAVEHAASPVALEAVRVAHWTVMLAEAARLHGGLPRDRLGPRLGAALTEGEAIGDAEYHAALRTLAAHRAGFWPAFGPGDLLLLPATPAVAPVGTATGDPRFIVPLTALGGAVATVRAGTDAANAMPVGACLAAAPGADALLAAFLRDTAPTLDL